MSNIAKHISDFRKSTPRYIQWILLGAALVVVVVLFVLLNDGKQQPKLIADEDSLPEKAELILEPNTLIDWSNTMVGDTQQAEITVSATTSAQIDSVEINVQGYHDDKDAGISAQETCVDEHISSDRPCTISIEFTPTRPFVKTSANVAIKWKALGNMVDYDEPEALTLSLGAYARPEPEQKTEPEPMPQIEEKPINSFAPLPVPEADEDDDLIFEGDDFEDDIEDIAPDVSFDEPEPVRPAPRAKRSAFGTGCSDFAFPGYNMAGVQSGWIKPVGGAYYYYPLSNTECTGTPSGIYNADTGYIMDYSDSTKKIGSDAEHIRYLMRERMPKLGTASPRHPVNKAMQLTADELATIEMPTKIQLGDEVDDQGRTKRSYHIDLKPGKQRKQEFSGYSGGDKVVSSRPYDRSFVLRQYKPIPATIVSDIQADPKLLGSGIPVRATVDRNVYSDNGRTVIIPTGTLMLGRVTGELPGPYKAIGRMEIEWYQFIRPDGVEFNFGGKKPFSADSQGRKGVLGHGSTDYLQQFVMPMLTAIVPAAVNLIAPISDAFVNQIDLDNNTVVQSGTVRSSEMAKNEIITAWNNVATKLLVDMMDNTTPPFSIAAGTRITVFSPVDLFVTCGQDDGNDATTRKCAILPYEDQDRYDDAPDESFYEGQMTQNMSELIGQVRSLMQSSLQDSCCDCDDEKGACVGRTDYKNEDACKSYSFATLDFYCRSFGTYSAVNNEKQKVLYENQKKIGAKTNVDEQGNKKALKLQYVEDEDGEVVVQNPFKKQQKESAAQEVIEDVCGNNGKPNADGCCPGETLTDMGDQGFNCCPDAGGDCFPPLDL